MVNELHVSTGGAGPLFPMEGQDQRRAAGTGSAAKFMVENPIDRQRAERYPLEDERWLCVYRHPVMTDEELAATPLSRMKTETLQRMERFFADDYRTIEGYLKCLAFDPLGRR